MPLGLWPFVINNPQNLEEKITVIKIDPETSVADLITYWSAIKADVNRLLGVKPLAKTSKKENLERDLAIFELKQAGRTCKEIMTIINQVYPDQLIGYHDVAKIIKRLKDYANKLLGQAG